MTPPENPIAFALHTLSQLKPGDVRLVNLTRELNHWLDVLRTQGKRTYFNSEDMIYLFQRMHDLSLVTPMTGPLPREIEPNGGYTIDHAALAEDISRGHDEDDPDRSAAGLSFLKRENNQ